MRLLNFLMILTLILTITSANADTDSTNKQQGEAIIIVDNETYTLPLKRCFSGKNLKGGKIPEGFVIASLKTKETKASGVRFSSIGNKTGKTNFTLQVGGDVPKGGTRYLGKMPYESFKDNKLTFKGTADSMKKENQKLTKEKVSISITISCHD